MRKACVALPLIALLAIATPAVAQVGYGYAAAIGDDDVFVGEPANMIGPGVVYVYRPGNGGWQQVQELLASDGRDTDGFGRSIAVDGDLLLVGADSAGAAYLFRRQAGVWEESARIAPDSPTAGFGAAVALGDDLVVVGAPEGNNGAGSVSIFEPDGEGWTLTGTIEGDGTDAAAGTPEGFGATVAQAGDWIFVGAPGGRVDMFLGGQFQQSPPAGSVYAFRRAGGDWSRVDKLEAPPQRAAGAMFGSSLALVDGEALIGAVGTDDLSGAVYRYVHIEEDASWTLLGGLAPFDAPAGGMFGIDLAMGDDEVLVGAPGAGTGRLEGRVYRFTRGRSGEWVAASKLGTTGLKFGSAYGAALAAKEDLVVAGLPGDDYGAGSAVIMTRLADGWDRSHVLSGARGLPAITGGEVRCVDGRAGIFECDNVDLVAFLPVQAIGGGRGVTTNDIWGWTDPQTDRDYAIVGMRDGTAFVDVSDPYVPVFVGKLPKSADSPASLWRDIKVYADHAFIVADASGPHGVQVFDLTRLRRFDGTPLAFSEAAHYAGVNSSHNIYINAESAFAYAVGNSSGGETCGGALHMINVEDPRNPIFAGCFEPQAGVRGPGGTHDVQCVTYEGPDERYRGREVCFSSDGRAFGIGDVTDKRNPTVIATATYPNLAYTHQGWLDGEHRYFYMNDEGDEIAGLVAGTRTLIWDVQDLEDPILVGEYTTDNPATDHNLYIVGDVMYQSNYRSGLHVLDISEREHPRPLGFFDTVPWGDNDGMGDILSGAIGSWSNYPFFDSGVVAVTSGKEGLFILKLNTGPGNP
ncbi:MAG TPA: choice-of-anchor B family protein [Acidobacteriota bacterium]|nr:choice-of-anchor B family protein [Acidobacteriota bacterium]